MPAKRYFISYLPVQHINGKMAPVKVKCANVPAGETPPDTSYWYGYRHKSTPTVSRYGIRSQHRLLEEKPYTASEEENRTLFTMSLQAVNTHRQIAADWQLCRQSFLQQHDYTTQIGFAVAICRQNSGIWPDTWTN